MPYPAYVPSCGLPRRPAQAQRRRAGHFKLHTCGSAGWRHKCLIRPTFLPAGSPCRPAQAQRRRAVRLHTCGSAGWRHTCLIRPTFLPAGSHPPVGPRKRSAAGRSGVVPAIVPDGGINALSGLRSLTQAHTPQDRQAQRRRAVRLHTCGSAGWRYKCLIRPTFLPAGSPPRTGKRSAAGRSGSIPAVVPDGGIHALSGL